MAKAKTQYVCQSCGSVSSRWVGKCEACGEWNSIVEEQAVTSIRGVSKSAATSRLDVQSLGGNAHKLPARLISGLPEFNRVCGGGLVPGSVSLIGGDPGIGKSTLLLQISCRLAQSGVKCLYVSGEEGLEQIRMRAQRLGLADTPLELASATDLNSVLATMADPVRQIQLVVVDSIQTMSLDGIDSAPGTVTQVRACSQALIEMAKRHQICVLLVGHVTKEGQLAGPRVLEHMVDTVLYFEGDRGHQFRILRTVKNRFGPTDEIGVFSMEQAGLTEVTNPSALFLAERASDMPGSAVLAAMEGTRPVLVEIQALVAPTPFAAPKRSAVGWDGARLSMILAVLEARTGLSFGVSDVYLNVAGGLKISETGADLAVAAALVSALRNRPLPEGLILFGEVGLGGEVRPVSQPELRLKEAAKLGFTQSFTPKAKDKADKQASMNIKQIGHLRELIDLIV